MAGGEILRLCTEVDADGIPLVRLDGDVDLSSVGHLEEVCRELARAGHVVVALDCSDLRFMDSSGLNACVRVHEDLANRGGRLELCSIPRHLSRLLQVAGLEGALAVRGTQSVRST